VAARINGEPFTLAELERELAFNRASYKLTNDRELVLQDLAGTMQGLIPSLLLDQRARQAGITVSEAEISAKLENYLAGRNSTVQELEAELQPYGYTAADIREIIARMLRAEKYVDQIMQEPGPHQEDFSGWLADLRNEAEVEILYRPPEASPLLGGTAPDFNMANLKGQQVSLSQFRGRPVILNFWATWCGPCREEMSLFQQAYEDHRDEGLVVLAVNFEEEANIARPYLEELGLTFEVLLDQDAALAKQYLVTGLPTTFFIDRQGLIRQVKLGQVQEDLLEEILAQIL
jgi:peroxiredoxin